MRGIKLFYFVVVNMPRQSKKVDNNIGRYSLRSRLRGTERALEQLFPDTTINYRFHRHSYTKAFISR